jgi:hypothetical protein
VEIRRSNHVTVLTVLLHSDKQAQLVNQRDLPLHFQKRHPLGIPGHNETLSITRRVSNKSLDLVDAVRVKGLSLAQPHEQEAHCSIRFL